MRRNPAQPKSDRKINTAILIETLNANALKTTIANVEYTQVMTRTWRNKDTGTRKAG